MRQWITAAAQDFRFAARSFLRSPVFTVAAILTIALGIGASAAVFSVVDRILFRSLPYPDANRLVSVGMLSPSADQNEFLTAPAYLRLRDRQTPFAGMAAFGFTNSCDLNEANPLRLRCAMVDADFLPIFGIRPAAGRLFTRAEDVANAPGVALLSFGFWTRRFAEDPAAIGTSIRVDGQPVTIVGVLPRDFELFNLSPVDLVRPAAVAINQESRVVRAFARLKPGFTVEQASAALAPLFEEERARVPLLYRPGLSLVVRGLRERQIWPVRTASWTLLGAVAMVLFMACVNVANLTLARSAGRRREFAIRKALGAGRGRLLRQALTESLLLSSLGAAAGCLLAAALLRVFTRIAPDGILRLDQASLDTRVLGFAAAAAIGAGILFGFAPAMERLRQALIAVQIAASMVLLTGAGLLIQTLWSMERVPLGFETRNAVAAHFTLRAGYSEAHLRGFYAALETRLRQYPAGAIAASIPPYGGVMGTPFSELIVDGRPHLPAGSGGNVAWRAVTPGYFEALGIPLLRGHTFDGRDGSMVLSESLASRLFGNEDPIGRRVSSSVVVGVVRDVRNNGVLEPAMPEYYRLLGTAVNPRSASVVVRSPLPLRDVAARIRADLAALDPTLPVRIETLDERVAGMVVRPRFNAAMLGGFAAAGLLVAAIGIYGVVAFLVAQRTRDIGIRMALGATPAGVARHFLAYAARWTAAGIALGTAGSLLATRLAASLLFGVTRTDASSLAVAAGTLTSAALTAAWLPSRRAARVDPALTLRQ
jgi:putative ABC transport system permease protein